MTEAKTIEHYHMECKDAKQWLLCPVCDSKTRTMLRRDTTLIHFPLFCPKCKRESVVDVRNGILTIIKEPDAKT